MVFWQRAASPIRYYLLEESSSWRRGISRSRAWSEIDMVSCSWDHGGRLSAAWSVGEGQ